MNDFSDYIIYVDESGDHSLTSINPEYPVFVLAFCIFRIGEYTATITPSLQNFKFRHFGHDMVILHEHELRKSEGPFQFLLNTARREPFLNELSQVMEAAEFMLIAVAIRKDAFRDRHRESTNPYNIALTFGLERVQNFLDSRSQQGRLTHIVFESRGKKEDGELELAFRRVCDGQNLRGDRLPLEIVIVSKQSNSTGLQLADLVARPIGRKLIKPEQINRAYEIVETKFDRSPEGSVDEWGLKVYP